jgi:3-dehydroquinate synthase class II
MHDTPTQPLINEPRRGLKRRECISALHEVTSTIHDGDGESIALWYDTRALDSLAEQQVSQIFAKIVSGGFNGVLLYPDNWRRLAEVFPARASRILQVSNLEELRQAEEDGLLDKASPRTASIVASSNTEVLARVRTAGHRSCLRTHVDDAASLHESFRSGIHHDCVMVSFKDPTNIPLELVIAELHGSPARLLKEVGEDVDDAVIALGVLELGSDGVITRFTTAEQFDRLAAKLDAVRNPTLKLRVGTIVGTRHLGLGYRSCIDTTHLFEQDEGLLVGSTSTGGILCCPEVFYLPYMELRPFRVNAAAVHSYIFHADDRTNYISELKAGSQVSVVNAAGRTRQVYVGRIKTEVRPLLLIQVQFDAGEMINIVMQDDWHVRVFSDRALPLHVTELRPGDKVLGYVTQPGRHVGVKVDEHIVEV